MYTPPENMQNTNGDKYDYNAYKSRDNLHFCNGGCTNNGQAAGWRAEAAGACNHDTDIRSRNHTARGARNTAFDLAYTDTDIHKP